MTSAIEAGARPPVGGQVLLAADDGYDAARTVWNAMVDRRPRMILRCASVGDVVAAVRFARDHELEIGVLCGGHSIVGHAVPDDGLMIDLRPMGAVRVDAGRRRARVQGGALLGALDLATEPYGLATTAGNVSHTGVGGLTLGGGMGWLARQHGLSCDNVVSFELVTADGRVLRASATEHPDLFWGLRGGGGNFGIVTEFEFALHPVERQTLVLEVAFPVAASHSVLAGWCELNASAPREATFTAAIGEVVTVGFVWVGDPGAGRRVGDATLASLRELGRPVVEQVLEPTYVELQTREDAVRGHAFRRYWKGHHVRELSEAAIAALLARDGDHLPNVSLQAYGGAIADVPDDATAFSQRDTAFEVIAASRWTDPAEDEARIEGARRYAGALEPFASGVYVNALADEGQAGVRRAYPPAKLARLSALKDAYDPGNVFHLNQNIRPTGAPR